MGGKGLYAIPGVIGLIGIVLLIVGIVTVAGNNAFTLKPFTNGGSVQVGSDGFGVYSSSPPVLQPACTAVGNGGSVVLDQPTTQTTVTHGSQTYTLIARTPDSFSGGTYTVTCTNIVGSLATGARGIGGTILGIFSIVGGVILIVIALVVLLILFLVRRSRRNRPQSPGGSSNTPQYQQPAGYARPQYGPTGYTPPGPGQAGPGQPGYGQQPPYGQR